MCIRDRSLPSEKSDIPSTCPYLNYRIYMDMQKFLRSGQNQIHERIALGLGSNVSPRFEYLNEAVKALDGFLTQLFVSTVYETDPIGITDQPLFLNACCVGWTDIRRAPVQMADYLGWQLESISSHVDTRSIPVQWNISCIKCLFYIWRNTISPFIN